MACGEKPPATGAMPLNDPLDDTPETYEGTAIVLSDTAITVDGAAITADTSAAVYAANDIVLIVLWVLASFESLHYLSVVVCFLAFLFNDLYGYINWKKMSQRQYAGQ